MSISWLAVAVGDLMTLLRIRELLAFDSRLTTLSYLRAVDYSSIRICGPLTGWGISGAHRWNQVGSLMLLLKDIAPGIRPIHQSPSASSQADRRIRRGRPPLLLSPPLVLLNSLPPTTELLPLAMWMVWPFRLPSRSPPDVVYPKTTQSRMYHPCLVGDTTPHWFFCP